MFNVLHFPWTGHLPLVILYAPSASIWLHENSLHTLLVRQPWRKASNNWLVLFLGASADTERAISCTVMPCLHNVCRVSCQSVIVVDSLIVSGEVRTPLQKTFTVWLRLFHVVARIEINCLACVIQTSFIQNFCPKAQPLTSSQKRIVTQSVNQNLESIHSDKTSESYQHDLIIKRIFFKGMFQII